MSKRVEYKLDLVSFGCYLGVNGCQWVLFRVMKACGGPISRPLSVFLGGGVNVGARVFVVGYYCIVE